MIWQQRAAYQAMATALAAIDLRLMLGIPPAIHHTPAAYVVSSQIEVPTSQLLARYRPILTLAVEDQDKAEAEWQIVDLVDRVCAQLMETDLGVCRAAITNVGYRWEEIGGTRFRLADVTLVLSSM